MPTSRATAAAWVWPRSPSTDVLTPGRYVGAAAVEDNDDDFATKMQALTEKLGEQMAKGAELDEVIRSRLGGLGYEF